MAGAVRRKRPRHRRALAAPPAAAPSPGTKAAMAGYVPGLLPANRSQEKEFVQAYEDVLERYKGTEHRRAPRPGLDGAGAAP